MYVVKIIMKHNLMSKTNLILVSGFLLLFINHSEQRAVAANCKPEFLDDRVNAAKYGYCWRFEPHIRNGVEAEQKCQAIGGHLIILDSRAKASVLLQFTKDAAKAVEDGEYGLQLQDAYKRAYRGRVPWTYASGVKGLRNKTEVYVGTGEEVSWDAYLDRTRDRHRPGKTRCTAMHPQARQWIFVRCHGRKPSVCEQKTVKPEPEPKPTAPPTTKAITTTTTSVATTTTTAAETSEEESEYVSTCKQEFLDDRVNAAKYGYCWRFEPHLWNGVEAEQKCQAIGGHLIILDSRAKASVLLQFTKDAAKAVEDGEYGSQLQDAYKRSYRGRVPWTYASGVKGLRNKTEVYVGTGEEVNWAAYLDRTRDRHRPGKTRCTAMHPQARQWIFVRCHDRKPSVCEQKAVKPKPKPTTSTTTTTPTTTTTTTMATTTAPKEEEPDYVYYVDKNEYYAE